jgi:anthranilate synthase component 1
MLLPDYADFLRLAQSATLVPVSKPISADLLTPVSAFLALAAGEREAFLLESVEGGERLGRYTFLGARPYMTLTVRGQDAVLARGRKKERLRGSPFKLADKLLREHRPAPVAGLPPFTAGAVGFFAYDAVRQLEKLPEKSRDDLHTPDCVLMFFDRLLAFDHVLHQIHIIAAADVAREKPPRAWQRALADIARIERKLARGVPREKRRLAARGPLRVTARTPHPDFLHDVRRIKRHIAAGDVFQAVLSQRFELRPGVAPFAIYRALRRVNPSPYMYYLRLDGCEVLGSSPEMLVKVMGRRLQYRPIAGTRPRGRDEADDRRLEQELRADEKERAEHVMLVDLGRNDLGRVSEYGSVHVRELMRVERYSHVMHLVSDIEGTLRPDLSAMQAFAACFPAGTLTGAPKVRAMQLLEELEPVRRGIYGGSVLYADFAGNLDSCIAIRTMLVQRTGKAEKGRAYVQAGAGIVADSVPEREYEECANKARALIRAVELAREGS